MKAIDTTGPRRKTEIEEMGFNKAKQAPRDNRLGVLNVAEYGTSALL
jgi:hypothetical protein